MVDIPAELLSDFTSELPSEGSLADVTTEPGAFIKTYSANLVKFSGFAAARRAKVLGIPRLQERNASELFGGIGSWVSAALTMGGNPSPLQVIDTTLSQFGALASSMGVASEVPILGAVIGLFQYGVDLGKVIYAYNNAKQIEGPKFAYSKLSDQDFVRETLHYARSTDLTGLFMPQNDASVGIESYNVELETATKVKTKIYVPAGDPLGGIGCIPNTPKFGRGWSWNTEINPYTRTSFEPWEIFKPATSQATTISWQSLLSNGRAAYLVDALALASAWRVWADNMHAWAWGTRYKGKTAARLQGVLANNLNLTPAQAEEVPQSYWRLVNGRPMYGDKLQYALLAGDVGVWAAEVQLARRQRKFLGTLTVAYCSENDPAFRSNPTLHELLMSRRKMLLDHPDVVHVDLAQVVDEDYRAVLTTRMGPKVIRDVPDPGFKKKGLKLAAGGVLEGVPAIPGPQYGEASPFLGLSAPPRKRFPIIPVAAAAAAVLYFLPKVLK